MDLSDPKLISPLLDDFAMGAPISDHHGIRCCPAMPNSSDKRYIVKIVSIPASQVQLDALLLAGAYSSQASALAYFKELAAGVVEEAEILKKLSRFEGFLPCEGVQVVPMEDKVGYDVYLLTPYGRSLERYMRKKPMTHLSTVNLGLDLCASMVVCRRAGYLYVDLKPSNIFVNEKNEYRIGDLGFVKLDSLKYASLPDKYRSAYTPPEVSDAWSSLNDTIDTYAIGMILYQVYNDGKLPFEGQAGNEPLPVPAYADYEMAEIILKAIAPDPADRWADPMQMGQALVAYMQRNNVNDVPVIPLPVADEPAPAEIVVTEEIEAVAEVEDSAPADAPLTEEKTVTEDDPVPVEMQEEVFLPTPEPVPAEAEEPAVSGDQEDEPKDEDPADLSFMDEMVSDDTAPNAETAEEVEYAEISDETSDILAQADELIAHETPEPVVAPEPIDIPMPAPIILEDEPVETHDEIAEEELPEVIIPPTSANEEATEEESDHIVIPVDEPAAEPEITPAEPEPDVQDEPDDPYDDVEPAPAKPKSRIGLIIGSFLLIIILALGVFAGYYYYNNYYLQTVYGLELQGSDNYLEVYLTTDVDESLLTVICTDTYGNTRSAAVENGKAVFENLNPDTIYKVKVVINGHHELRGDITDDYTTPSQTNIVRFDAIAGSEDGSVILNFTIDGKDSNTWTVTYTAEGENEKSVTFSGHLVTINGLSLNKLYTFTLSTDTSLYIVGNDTVTFQSVPLVFAENVDITACNDAGLTAVWTAPADVQVSSWTVRCYSASGYDQSIVTSDTTATFTDLDPSQAYTVEVIAEGMTVGTRDYVSANSATITGFTADTSVPLEVTVRWDYTGTAPASGWLVFVKEVGSEEQEVIQTNENKITIYPALPGTSYELVVAASDGTTVFDGSFACEAGAVKTFSGYTVSTSNMTFWMVRHPGYNGWSWRDIKRADYTNTFTPGEKAAFIIKLNKKYSTSPDVITSLFVVRDASGKVVCTSTSSSSWTYMWYQFYCELDIPTMPTEPGTYTMNLYFNGMAVTQTEFTIS